VKIPKYLIDEKVPLGGATAEIKAWVAWAGPPRGSVVTILSSIVVRCDTCGARLVLSDIDGWCEHHRPEPEPEPEEGP